MLVHSAVVECEIRNEFFRVLKISEKICSRWNVSLGSNGVLKEGVGCVNHSWRSLEPLTKLNLLSSSRVFTSLFFSEMGDRDQGSSASNRNQPSTNQSTSDQNPAGSVQSSASGVTLNESLQALLDAQKEAILAAVNTQISGLKASIDTQQQDLAANFVRSEEEVPVFKKKGNEQQYKFNQKVLNTNKRAIKALEGNNVQRAKELLKEGTVLINDRQKLIKLADKSEFGWNTIREYVDDDLADNEADSKKIKKAEKRAGERVKAIQEKKRKQNKPPQRNFQPSTSAISSNSSNSVAHHPQYFRSQHRSSFDTPARFHDFCYRCGKRGHWASQCSRNSNASTSK